MHTIFIFLAMGAYKATVSNPQMAALLAVSCAGAVVYAKKKGKFKAWLLKQHLKLLKRFGMSSRGKQNFLLVIVILFFAAILLGTYLLLTRKK